MEEDAIMRIGQGQQKLFIRGDTQMQVKGDPGSVAQMSKSVVCLICPHREISIYFLP